MRQQTKRSRLTRQRAVIALGLGAVVIIGVIAALEPGVARPLFVDRGSLGGTCDDSRPARLVTLSTPWCSLGRALAAAPAGSTVLVRGGSYPTVVASSYAPSSRVTFEAYPGERPELGGIDIGSGRALSRNFAFRGFKIVGFGVRLTDFRDVAVSGNEIALTPVAPIGCPATCVVRTPTAVLLTPPASGLTFAGNYVHDGALGIGFRLGQPPSAPGHPLADTYRDIMIEGNVFARMGDVVLSLQNFEGVTVKDNTFADDFLRPGIDPGCHCDSVHAIGGGDRLLLDGNVVYGGRGFLIQPGYPDGGNCEPACLEQTNVTIENNVKAGDEFALRVLSSPGIKILNNKIWPTQVGPQLGLTFLSSTPATTGAVVVGNVLRYFEADPGVRFAAEDHNDVIERGTGPGYATPAPGPHDASGAPSFARTWSLARADCPPAPVARWPSGWRRPGCR